MSILDDFFATDSIRLDPVDLNVDEPPRFGTIELIPRAPRTEVVSCVSKRLGTLDATLTILGLTIPFTGSFLGVDSRGRWLLRWSVDDFTPRRALGTTIEHVKGQVTVVITALDPARTDLTTCADAAGEFFVSASLVQLADLDERFTRLPDGTLAQNEVRVWASGVTPTHAFITGMRGDAGRTAPPPTPWPQPLWITFNTNCVPSARVMPRVFGQVHLDHPVLRSHTGFDVSVLAQAVDSSASFTVNVRRPFVIGSTVIFFEVLLPPDFSGMVRVTAETTDRMHRTDAQFRVGDVRVGGVMLGCQDAIDVLYYDILPVGCEAWDCGWTAMNDLAEMIGRTGGWAARRLTSRHIIDPVGRLVGEKAVLRAINNHGTVVGVIDYGEGKVDGFIYGEPLPDGMSAPELQWVPGVSLQALNDAGIAVGSRWDGDRTVPVRVIKGQLEPIKVPALYAVPLAINEAGEIAGVYMAKDGKLAQGFVVDEKGFHELGDLGGNVISLAMNGIGAVAGTVRSGEKTHGFVYSPQAGLIDLKLPMEADQFSISGINETGIVVGTFWNDKDPTRRAFRFTLERGFENLSLFQSPERAVTLESAIAINNLGQILVTGNKNGEAGHFLLNPASIPTPQLPIP